MALGAAWSQPDQHRLAIGGDAPGDQDRFGAGAVVHLEVRAVQEQLLQGDVGQAARRPCLELVFDLLADAADKPTAKDNQVLVKVHATTVNRTDSGFRAGKPFIVRLFTGLIRPKVTVLGNEFAGQVEAVGGGVTSFVVGDRVFGYSGLQHGSRFGAHAEYLAMPEHGSLATIPANLSYEQAAPSTEGAHYALTMIRTAKIQLGHDVLVYGATGAIGTSPRMSSATAWSWMRSARARSSAAGDC
jgi:D-arabinose 1-dehydrogenase-like Zn-dependent alcohol dehydrogenase